MSVNQTLVADSDLAGFGRVLIGKMTENNQDVSILIVGDSTSASYGSWVGTMVAGIATRFSAYTVKYYDWTDGNATYNTSSTKQTGSGSNTLNVYNCAVGSKSAHFHQAPYFDTMIASKQADLIFLAHGHNHGGSGTPAEPFWRDELTKFTQIISRFCPKSEIVLIATNPRVDVNAPTQAQRQHVTEQVANLCGYGFVNIHKLFLETDPAVTSLLQDEIHPNATGYALWGNEILRLLSVKSRVRPQERSSLLEFTNNYALNGDFSSFTSPPAIPSWSTVNVTVTKDTSVFESPNGYSVKLVTTTPGSASYISQVISGSKLRDLQGGWVTLAARVYVGSSQSYFAGRVQIQEINGSNTGTSTSSNLIDNSGFQGGINGWKWMTCTRRIATDVTTLSILVQCENTGTGEVRIDRVGLSKGIFPRDPLLGSQLTSSTEISNTIIDAKGDLIAGTADNSATRLPVGTDGQTLVADSTQSAGLKWAAGPAPAAHASTHQYGGSDALALPQYDPFDALPYIYPMGLGATTTSTITAKRGYFNRFTVSKKREFKFVRWAIGAVGTGTEDKVEVAIFKVNGSKLERLGASGAVKTSFTAVGVRATELTAIVECVPGVVYFAAWALEVVNGTPQVLAVTNNNGLVGDIGGTGILANRAFLIKSESFPFATTVESLSPSQNPWLVPSSE